MATFRQKLEDELGQVEKDFGVDSPLAKHLRTQLEGMKAADGKASEELYFSGRPVDSKGE